MLGLNWERRWGFKKRRKLAGFFPDFLFLIHFFTFGVFFENNLESRFFIYTFSPLFYLLGLGLELYFFFLSVGIIILYLFLH